MGRFGREKKREVQIKYTYTIRPNNTKQLRVFVRTNDTAIEKSRSGYRDPFRTIATHVLSELQVKGSQLSWRRFNYESDAFDGGFVLLNASKLIGQDVIIDLEAFISSN